MSTPTTNRRPWWLVALAILTVGGVVAAALAVIGDDEESSEARRPGPSAGSIGDPTIEQASWRIKTERGPSNGPRSKKQQKSYTKQRKALNEMTRDVFDALFLSPERTNKALKAGFTPKARKAYLRAKVGVPKGADDVKVSRRSARISISDNARATLNIRIVARGRVGDGKKDRFAVEHRSALYASRQEKGWKVFGFTVDQKPFKRDLKNTDKGKGGPDSKSKDDKKSKGSKKKRDKVRNKGKVDRS